MISLIEHGSLTTTLPKAKELRPFAEKLITKSRRSNLASRRAVISALGTDVEAANRLIDVIAPQISRDSGYLRIVKEENRVGDNAEMATIEFVDELKFEPAETAEPAKSDDKEDEKS
jgi:large subunit ribosomal protein L17